MSAARLAWFAIAVLAACGGGAGASAPTVAAGSPTASATPQPTKPPFSQPPLDPPTYTRWGIDRGDQPGRPRLFELYYDGAAYGFRIVDAAGRQVLRLPIAGSGIFGPETCLVAATSQARGVVATWVSVDEAAYADLAANGAGYRVEVDTIGHGTIVLPLTDSGCRR